MLETRDVSDTVTRRRHQCKDRHRWSTYERVDMATVDATGSVGRTLAVASMNATRSGRPPPGITTTRSVQTLPVAFGGTPVGDLGGSDLSGISLCSSKLLTQTQTQTQTRVGRREYPEAFEAEWRQTSRTGSKDKAVASWEKLGQPQFGVAWARWSESDEWRQSWHNDPHVVTWLNDGRWQQEPPPSVVRTPRLPEKTEASRAVVTAWAKGMR